MNIKTPTAAIAILLASAAAAQNSPATQPIPGLDNFSLPSSRPTPRRAPEPEPTVRPTASATPRAVAPPVVVPTVRATPATRAASAPARATPLPARAVAPRPVSPSPSAPVATPTPLPTAQSVTPVPTTAPPAPVPATIAPTPVAISQPAAPVLEPDHTPWIPLWVWLMAACVVLAVVIGSVGWWWPRLSSRRADDLGETESREIFVPVADDMPSPALAAAPAALAVPAAPWLTGDRATLDLELIPNRAGTDPAALVVEYLIVVRNTGRAAAIGVRLDVRLLGAGPGQEAMITALFAAPIDAPITAPFDLPAGATAEFEGAAAHPRDTLQSMTIGGQRSVVPVLAVNVRYDWQVAGQGRGDGQTAHSYVVGIARGAEAKLQPFPLDGPDRMQASVSALDYTVRMVS